MQRNEHSRESFPGPAHPRRRDFQPAGQPRSRAADPLRRKHGAGESRARASDDAHPRNLTLPARLSLGIEDTS